MSQLNTDPEINSIGEVTIDVPRYRATSQGLLKKSHAFGFFCVPILVVQIVVIFILVLQSQKGGESGTALIQQIET